MKPEKQRPGQIPVLLLLALLLAAYGGHGYLRHSEEHQSLTSPQVLSQEKTPGSHGAQQSSTRRHQEARPADSSRDPAPESRSNPQGEESSPTDYTWIHPPTTRLLRKEALRDPHAPPPTLVRFADELAAKIQDAQDSSGSATRLFSELSECVGAREGAEDSPPAQIQALCLNAARSLAQSDPQGYQASYDSLKSRAQPGALRLQSALEALESR